MSIPGRILRVVGRLSGALVALTALGALVVGVPWGLWHYIGWPLPTQLPTAGELGGFLLAPLSVTTLLDLLACVAWPLWLLFVVDVARCVPDTLRGVRVPALGPVHALAGFLVAAGVLGLLGPRSPSAPSTPIVVDAPAPAVVHDDVRTLLQAGPVGSAPAAGTVIVRAPENGVHDSLWDIAGRTLDDATRWPEIFEANRGKPQPNGGTLTNPDLIFPGEQLALPLAAPPGTPANSGDHDVTPPGAPPPPAPPSPPSTTATPPLSTAAAPGPATSPSPLATGQPATPAPTAAPVPGSRGLPGIPGGPGVFVGLGLAAAVSAAVLVARRRYRRAYRPGSGRRDDLPVAPVVYQLRLAHLWTGHGDTSPDADDSDADHGPAAAPPALVIPAPDAAATGIDARAAPGLGVRDGREIALDLAAACGLGLLGAGAPAAARALLLTMLAPTPSPTGTEQPTSATEPRVIVPVEDPAVLLGRYEAPGPAGLRVVADLDAALDELETEILSRTRQHDAAPESTWPIVALVARLPARNTQRLQAVLEGGARLGVVGVLLGQWRPGVSAYIRADGTVSATSPGLGEPLRGTQMFRMPETETVDLLALLRQAQPDTPSYPPATGSTSLDVVDDIELEVTALPDAEPGTSGPRLVPGPAPPREPDPPPDHEDPAEHQPHSPDEHESPWAGSGPELASGVDEHESSSGDLFAKPIVVTVLGSPRVHWTPGDGDNAADAAVRDITAAFPPRQRELLVFLALYPGGVHRDALMTALWDDHAPQRPTNVLNTALSRLRRAVNTATDGAINDITTIGESRYQLDPHLVEVDYWRFSDAVRARRTATTDRERITAYRRIVDCYSGCLAEGMDTEWIDAAREATRRDAIDAVAALARALVDSDPQRTLDLLETARAFDPHNELLYRDIMRLQERLGRLDAIPRTLTLLTTRLAEIDDRPTAHAVELAARLQQRNDTAGVTAGTHHPLDFRSDRRDSVAAS